MQFMVLQDILKLIIDIPFANSNPLIIELVENLAISSTKEDPIDRDEACYNDFLDFFEKITKTYIQQHAVFFDRPDSICKSFQRAISFDKLQIQQVALQTKKRRDEYPAYSPSDAKAT